MAAQTPSQAESGQKVPAAFALYAASSLLRDLVWATLRAGVASVIIFVPQGLRRVAGAIGLGTWTSGARHGSWPRQSHA